MQSYYLHQECSPPLAARNIHPFNTGEEGQFVVLSRGKQVEIHRLLDGDLTFHQRSSFHAGIERMEVVPSKHHPYDFLWVLDKKGRFCFWHPEGIDLVDNTILWEYAAEIGQQKAQVYSGCKHQFEGKNTEGNIFFTNGQLFVLIRFSITQQGVTYDQKNVIKYHLPAHTLRFAEWIHHSISLFLVGLITEQEGKTYLTVYDLEKGIGICKESEEWRFERTNLLHFVSQISGEMLIITYNEASLHNYKNQNCLKSYRTRGNYGQGFYLADEGMYGHIGEELIAFNRDRLVSYGQVKYSGSICLNDCKVLGKIDDGTALSVTHYEGDSYLLRIFSKTFTFYPIFTNIGPILEMCRLKDSDSLFAVASQTQTGFQVSLLQLQYRIQVRQQVKLPQKYVQQLLTINGGIYLILCSEYNNEVYRLRGHQYQQYFSLPQGSILAADGKFIVYDDAIYEIDYQSSTMTVLEQRALLLAQVTGDIIYFLDYEGNLHSFDDSCEDTSTVTLKNRSADYCWGIIAKTNSLITANLLEPKQVAIINDRSVKYVSIKGHTLVCSLSSISTNKSRHESEDRILIGYVDGQIHLQYFKNDYFHSTQVFTNFCSMPVYFIPCGDSMVLANYNTKQYLLKATKEEIQLVNVSFGREGASNFLFGYLQKTSDLCFIDNNESGKQISFKKIASSALKNTVIRQKSKIFRFSKLQEWVQSIPKLLSLEDRLIVSGHNEASLINLQNGKQIRSYHHGFKEIIGLSSIKMGIILCGVNRQSNAQIVVLSQDLQFICKFSMQDKKEVRCLKAMIEENQFLLAYSDSVTFYKITENKQLINLLGSKLQLNAYHIDICDNTILLNDPFRSVSVLSFKQSINCLGSYLPPYQVVHACFIGSDILLIDERGTLTLIYTLIDETIDFHFKFLKLSSFNLGDSVSAIHPCEDCLFYTSEEGQIGVIRSINRDEFDTLKKIETQSLLQNEQHQFSYWQWRSRPPAHERLIDCEIFPENPYLLSSFRP